MHRSTLPKLLALFLSGSILFSSVPVYAEVCHLPDEPAEKGGVKEYENWEYGSMYYPLWTNVFTAKGSEEEYNSDLAEYYVPMDGGTVIEQQCDCIRKVKYMEHI